MHMLDRIVNHLIINTSFVADLGLYHGRMGIVLFFVHYSRYMNTTIYNDFARDLMDEITEDIHRDVPINFEYGLSGIGWSVNYLLQNEFMKGDPDDILVEIDQKIMEKNLLKMPDVSVCAGLKGIFYYIHKRIESSKSSHPPFDHTFLNDYEYMKQKLNIVIPDDDEILATIFKKKPKGCDITKWQLGLDNGCAGYGLKLIY